MNPSIIASTRIAGVLILSYASKLDLCITGFSSFEIILRMTSLIISVLIIFFNPKRFASSNAMDDVPTPEAPPIKIIKGSSDFLTVLHRSYFLEKPESTVSKYLAIVLANSSTDISLIPLSIRLFSISLAISYA